MSKIKSMQPRSFFSRAGTRPGGRGLVSNSRNSWDLARIDGAVRLGDGQSLIPGNCKNYQKLQPNRSRYYRTTSLLPANHWFFALPPLSSSWYLLVSNWPAHLSTRGRRRLRLRAASRATGSKL
jgi:hypothetical protein